MANNSNNSSGTKKGKGILTTFGGELGYIESRQSQSQSSRLKGALHGYRYENLPADEIARRQKVAKKLAELDRARHLSIGELFAFLGTLTKLSESVRDEHLRGINKYNDTLDSLANHTGVVGNHNAPELTYDKEKINTKKLKSVIRVAKLKDAMRIIDKGPYIQKSVVLIGNAYNKYVTIGSSVKSYIRTKKNLNISLYDINKSVVLPEIVDPLLESLYNEFYKKLDKSLYEPTDDIWHDDWYEDCS